MAIMSFEDFVKSNTVPETNENEVFEGFEISEEELAEITNEYSLNEGEFQVTEPKMEDGAITLKIGATKYKFHSPDKNVEEIFGKFKKMMGFAKAGGKALAWLTKQLGKGQKIEA